MNSIGVEEKRLLKKWKQIFLTLSDSGAVVFLRASLTAVHSPPLYGKLHLSLVTSLY